MRYLFTSECGDIYLLAFNLNQINLMSLYGIPSATADASNFMLIEFLG